MLKRRNSVTDNKSKFETGEASNAVPAYKPPDTSIAKAAKGLQLKKEYDEGGSQIRNSEASLVLAAVAEAKEEDPSKAAGKSGGNGSAGSAKLDKKAQKAAAKEAEKQRKAAEKQRKKEEKARKKSK